MFSIHHYSIQLYSEASPTFESLLHDTIDHTKQLLNLTRNR